MGNLLSAFDQAKQAFYNFTGKQQPDNFATAERRGFAVPTYSGPPKAQPLKPFPVYYSAAQPKTANIQVAGAQNQPIQAQAVDVAKIENAIRKGLIEYGANPRLVEFAPLFAQAAQKYPIFAKNPFLLPQIAILETSGGRNITRPNNPLNWGARVQATGNYNPLSWQESINDAITAIGGDPLRGPAGSTRQKQTTYYQPFRESGDLKTFANIYEPDNGDYYDALVKGLPLFEKYYNK